MYQPYIGWFARTVANALARASMTGRADSGFKHMVSLRVTRVLDSSVSFNDGTPQAATKMTGFRGSRKVRADRTISPPAKIYNTVGTKTT